MQSTADTALGYMKAWGTKAKQYALNLTDIEIKTEQATNNDPWGPHGTAMGGEIRCVSWLLLSDAWMLASLGALAEYLAQQ